MQIQINTDKNIDGNERLVSFYTSELEKELARFDDKITRVEVHFGDENSEKFSKNDKRCLIEVRIVKKEPLAVTEYADTIEKAFYGTITKIKKVLTVANEKMHQH